MFFREAGLIGDAGLSGGARASSDDKITPSTTPSHTHDILTVSTDPNSASAATQDAAPSAADRNLYLDLHHPLLQLARSPRTIRRQISDPMVGCLGTRYLPVSPLATGDLPSGQELKFLVSPTKKSFEAPGSPIITTFAARQALFRPVSTHDSSLEDTMPLSSSLGNISSAVQLSGDWYSVACIDLVWRVHYFTVPHIEEQGSFRVWAQPMRDDVTV